MSRQIYNPSIYTEFFNLFEISNGGTGATDAATARENLDLIAASDLGAENGVAQLNSFGTLDFSNFSAGLFKPVMVDGASSVNTGTTNSYVITNYDSRTSYTVSASNGTVSRLGDTITYVAPSTPGIGGFEINDQIYLVTITQAVVSTYVNQPSITSPTNNAIDRDASVSITASAFAVTNGTDTHLNSSWQVATDSAFSTIIASVANSTTFKTTWTVTGLLVNTDYYLRVKYTGTAHGDSAWSSVIHFKTKVSFVSFIQAAAKFASDKYNEIHFGSAVALSADGTLAIVGAEDGNLEGSGYYGQGAAYFLSRTGSIWSNVQKINSPSALSNLKFGCAVAMNSTGTIALIGATYDRPSVYGAVYIYTRIGNVWSNQGKLTLGSTGDLFGCSIALSADGNLLLVGSTGYNSGNGAVNIYTKSGSTWAFQQRLTGGVGFGSSIALSADGTLALIGNTAKVITVFTRNGIDWTQQGTLEYAGTSVALNADATIALVGNSSSSKVVALSRANTVWTSEQVIDRSQDDSLLFGSAVALSADGSLAMIGDKGYGDTEFSHCGIIYYY